MIEQPERCYDAGYAAGRTLQRTQQVRSEHTYAASLGTGLQGWSTAYFARATSPGVEHRRACESFFAAGFEDGYWNRPCRRAAAVA